MAGPKICSEVATSLLYIPVVYFLVCEDVADEADACDEVHEDGEKGETVPPRLPRHLGSYSKMS